MAIPPWGSATGLRGQSLVYNEVPGGTVNGSNVTFTLASTPATNALDLYINGIRLKPGGADYTLAGSTITFVTAPATGSILLADYAVSSTTLSIGTNSIIVGEVPVGLVNSSNAVYTFARSYIAGSVEVFINGLAQARTTNFTETTPASGIITMGTAPVTGDIITVNYQYNLNPASNADTVDGIHASSTATANQLLSLDANSRFPATTQTLSGCGLTHSTTQSISDSTIQAVVFNTEEYDTDSYHSTSSNTSRVIAPNTAKFSLTTTIAFTNNATGVRYVFFCINGATGGRYGAVTVAGTGGGLDTIVTATATIPLTAGDYVETYVYQNSGGALNVLANTSFPGGTRLTCTRMGA